MIDVPSKVCLDSMADCKGVIYVIQTELCAIDCDPKSKVATF